MPPKGYNGLTERALLPLRASHENMATLRALGTLEDAAWYFAKMRFNAVVLEGCGYSPISVDLPEAKEALGRYGIELIPEIQGLGHGGPAARVPECLEVPGRTATCPSRSRTYDVVREVVEEVVEQISPRYVHWGCDEVRWIGECSRCEASGMSKEQLFATYVNGVTAIAKSLQPQVRGMIWADTINPIHWSHLQLPGALELLDKGVICCAWNYGSEWHPLLYTLQKITATVEYFADKGVTFTGSPWNTPAYCEHWCKELVRRDALGVIVTNWGGRREGNEVTGRAAWEGGS